MCSVSMIIRLSCFEALRSWLIRAFGFHPAKDVSCALWQEPRAALPVSSHLAALVSTLAAAA
jgi:hypothetical protein